MSRASGADAYVHWEGTGARSFFRSSSVKGEVVRALVRARLLLPQLHENVVEQRRRAEPVEVRRQPVRSECLVELDEVLDGLLRLTDAACRLHPDHATGLVVDVPDRLEHARRYRQG